MNKKYNKYVLALFAIVLLVLVFVLIGTKDSNKEDSINTDTTSSSNKPSGSSSKPGSSSNPANSTTSKPAAPSLTMKSLDGQVFRLASYNGLAVPSESRYTISFVGGDMNAKFCNNLSGSFVLDSGVIKSPNIVGTKMYCNTPSNLMDIENSFVSILNFGANITKLDNGIMISGPKGSIFVFTGFTN